MVESNPDDVSYIWKCQCGKIEIHLKGEPLFVANCHCRSCVSSARYVEGKEGAGGTSMLSEGGGSASVGFGLEQVVKVTKKNGFDVGHVVVGEKGRIVRPYAKCCNTRICNGGTDFVAGQVRVFNLNALYNSDGTTKYQPPNVIPNIEDKNSFDPDSVPDPKVTALQGLSFAVRVVPYILRDKIGFNKLNEGDIDPIFMCEIATAEHSPKTW